MVVGFAAYNGWQQETVISSFQLPPDNKEKAMPFGGETVADTLQDALSAVQKEAEGQSLSPPCDQFASKDEKFGGLTGGPGTSFQVAGHIAVEVKGISVAALVSVAREVLGQERNISGDVLVDGPDKFELTARANDAGPWVTRPQQLSPDGLKRAACELAEQILESTDRNLLAAALIRRGEYQRVVGLYAVMPTGRDKLADALNNLGIALRRTRRTDDAIVKFHQALGLRTKFPQAH